jgi:hypothetical protein
MKGRPAGSDENLLAAIYIAKQFNAAGLSPLFENKYKGRQEQLQDVEVKLKNADRFSGYFQKFNFQNSQLSDNNTFCLTKKLDNGNIKLSYQYSDDYFIKYGGMEDIEINAPVVFAGYGIDKGEDGYNDYKDISGNDIDVKNKIVVIIDSYPLAQDENSPFSKSNKKEYRLIKFKERTAAEKGALAVLVIQSPLVNAGPLSEYLGRITNAFERESSQLHETRRNKIPLIYLSQKIALELFNNLEEKSLTSILEKIDASLKPQSFQFHNININLKVDIKYKVANTQNVIGFLEGTDPVLKDEFIVIGAHYDHIGLGYYGTIDKNNIGQIHNGADDNASGTSGLLELAEAFSNSPPKRSVLFIAFAAEENGLLGSRYYVYRHSALPLEKTVAMINLDMIGRNEQELLWVGGAFQGRDIINTVKDANKELGFELLYNVGLYSKASDQAYFFKKKIPAVFFFTGIHDDYHSPTDDVDKIEFDKAERVTKLAYLTGWILCNQENNPTYEDIPMDERVGLIKDSGERMKKFRKVN